MIRRKNGTVSVFRCLYHPLLRSITFRFPLNHIGVVSSQIFAASIGNYDFIARFVALMGTNVIAIEPPEVAERVSDIFAALAAAYSDVESSGNQR